MPEIVIFCVFALAIILSGLLNFLASYRFATKLIDAASKQTPFNALAIRVLYSALAIGLWAASLFYFIGAAPLIVEIAYPLIDPSTTRNWQDYVVIIGGFTCFFAQAIAVRWYGIKQNKASACHTP